MNEPDPVPIYTSTPGIAESTASLHALPNNHKYFLLRTPFPLYYPNGMAPATLAEPGTIGSFFAAIDYKYPEVVAMMIESKFVTPATLDEHGRTPLIAATAAGNVRMVQDLVDFGADVDAWGKWQGKERTCLMVAAAQGNLTLVKLFVDVYHANDALIAPDGQMALRMAVERGWKEVVEFLPARRGGGWRRWKVQHAIALKRAKTAILGIWQFFKVLGWQVPKYFVWTLPKVNFFQPLRKCAVQCWRDRKKFVSWCKRKVVELPEKAEWAAVWAKRTAVEFVKGTWKFITETIPKLCKDFVKYCQSLVTVEIPAALKAFGQWLQQGVKVIGHSLSFIASRIASFLHTAYTAVLSFFRNLTLKDIWNGFRDILSALYMAFPAKLWAWAKKFEDMSYRVMEVLEGVAGEVLWCIGRIFVSLVAYVPEKLWTVISSLGRSAARGCYEVVIWIDPKK